MKRLLILSGLLALAGCASVQPLSAPAPSGQAETAQGWARHADLKEALGGDAEAHYYTNCADLAAKDGDQGTEILCLESAYRLAGGPRWQQEETRATLARRMQAIKARQGRKGAAASYGVIAAVSEAYLDGGQGAADRQAYEAAQARIAAAKAAQQKAADEASAQFMSSVMSSAFSAGMGLTSNEAATMSILQSEMTYLEKDSSITEAGKGLGDAESLLAKSAGPQVEARASHLLAAALASAEDPEPYAKAAQAELRKSGLGARKGAIAEFLAQAPPGKSRSEKRDFVQAFQAAEKSLWKADLAGEPLPLAAVKSEKLGKAWDEPQSFSLTSFVIQGFHEGPYKRTLKFDSTSGGKSLKVPVTMTAEASSTNGLEMGAEILPYPGAGFHFFNAASLQFGTLSFPTQLTATGSTWGIADRLGLGMYFPVAGHDMLGLALDASTLLFQVGESNIRWGSTGYDSFDFSILGLQLEASARLFHVLRLGVALPVAAPFGTDDKRDAGGLRITAGLAFSFSADPPSKRIEAARAGLPPAPVEGGKVTRVEDPAPTPSAAKAGQAQPTPRPTPQPTPKATPKPTPQPALEAEKAALQKEREALRLEREKLRKEREALLQQGAEK